MKEVTLDCHHNIRMDLNLVSIDIIYVSSSKGAMPHTLKQCLPTLLSFMMVSLFLAAALAQNPEYQKKMQVHEEQTSVREEVGLKYGENTESITFSMSQMTDFVVKTQEEQEVKMTMHSYWRQDNIYISSEYREGENMRVVIYEDNYRILADHKFYVTWGIKFTAQKGKEYLIRFVDEGSVTKLIAMEMTKTSSSDFENVASTDQFSDITRRINVLKQEIHMMAKISEFGIVIHEQESKAMNHSTCMYMGYLIGEAALVLLVVLLQVKYMTNILNKESVI